MSEKISRREFLKVSAAFLGGATAACIPENPLNNPSLSKDEEIIKNNDVIDNEEFKVNFGKFSIGKVDLGLIQDVRIENDNEVTGKIDKSISEIIDILNIKDTKLAHLVVEGENSKGIVPLVWSETNTDNKEIYSFWNFDAETKQIYPFDSASENYQPIPISLYKIKRADGVEIIGPEGYNDGKDGFVIDNFLNYSVHLGWNISVPFKREGERNMIRINSSEKLSDLIK